MLGLLWCLSWSCLSLTFIAVLIVLHRGRALTQVAGGSGEKQPWLEERGKMHRTYVCPSYLISPALKDFRRRRGTLSILMPCTHSDSA